MQRLNMWFNFNNFFNMQKGFESMEMERREGEEYNTNSSSDSFYVVHVDMQEQGQTSKTTTAFGTKLVERSNVTTSTAISIESLTLQIPAAFASQFQEMVMRLLMQSMGALLGSAPAVQLVSQGGPSGTPILSASGPTEENTWREASFHKAEARCKRKNKMTRTSAGEDSNSQKDYLAAENTTPQQKCLRIRRINRC